MYVRWLRMALLNCERILSFKVSHKWSPFDSLDLSTEQKNSCFDVPLPAKKKTEEKNFWTLFFRSENSHSHRIPFGSPKGNKSNPPCSGFFFIYISHLNLNSHTDLTRPLMSFSNVTWLHYTHIIPAAIPNLNTLGPNRKKKWFKNDKWDFMRNRIG